MLLPQFHTFKGPSRGMVYLCPSLKPPLKGIGIFPYIMSQTNQLALLT